MSLENQNFSPLTKYQFVDEHGHALENCVEFQDIKDDIDWLTGRALMLAKSKQQFTTFDKLNIIRAKWGLELKEM